MAKYTYQTIKIYRKKDGSPIVTPSNSFMKELEAWVAFKQSQKDRLKATISALGLEHAAASAETTELTEQLRSVVEALGTITDKDNCQTFIKAHEHNPIVTAMQTCMSNQLISSTILNSHRQVHDEDADLIYTKSTALYVIELIHFTIVNQDYNIHYILPPQHHANKHVAQGFCVVNLEPLHRALEITGARNHSVFSSYLISVAVTRKKQFTPSKKGVPKTTHFSNQNQITLKDALLPHPLKSRIKTVKKLSVTLRTE